MMGTLGTYPPAFLNVFPTFLEDVMDLSAFLEDVLELPAADSVSGLACEPIPIEVNFRVVVGIAA